MIVKIEWIKDIVGVNYIGVNIYAEAIYSFLQKMKDYTSDSYDEYVKNQQDRDRNHYHCTLFNVSETNKILQNINNINLVNQIMTDFVAEDFQMLGLGSAQRNENKAYFVVCRSEQLQSVRKRFGFTEKDLHITLGFKWKDVHGVPKNKILDDKQPFKDELSKYFFDFGESFDFVKGLDGYEYDLNKSLYVTKITDTYATFRIGNDWGVSDYITISLIANKLTIACKWQDSEEIPYLSHTLILRKLKKSEE
jgi:hypothetical protein